MAVSRIFLFIVALSLISCDNDSESKKLDNEQVLLLMENAKETLLIGNIPFVLEAYIWRDYMPVIPPEGRGIVSINWLVSPNSIPMPNHINMVKQYVIYEDKVWDADYESESDRTYFNKIERISRNGPQWETGISVTVVSQIYDSETKTNYYIKCNDVTIHRTD